jgi:hypothetical protein
MPHERLQAGNEACRIEGRTSEDPIRISREAVNQVRSKHNVIGRLLEEVTNELETVA